MILSILADDPVSDPSKQMPSDPSKQMPSDPSKQMPVGSFEADARRILAEEDARRSWLMVLSRDMSILSILTILSIVRRLSTPPQGHFSALGLFVDSPTYKFSK